MKNIHDFLAELTIIYVAYGEHDYLYQSIESLAKCDQKLNILIINNDETHKIKNLVFENLAIKIIPAHYNRGFARANNIASRLVSTKWVLFLNPDTLIPTDFFLKLFEKMNEYKDCKSFAPRLMQSEKIVDGFGDVIAMGGLYYRSFHGKEYKFSGDAKVFGACGACHLIDRKLFIKHKFNPKLFCYGEDVDLAFKLHTDNIDTIQLNNVYVTHLGSKISKKNSDFYIFYGNRNRIIVTFSNLPFIVLIFYFPLFLLLNLFMLIKFLRIGKQAIFIKSIFDACKEYKYICQQRKKIKFSQEYQKRIYHYTEFNIFNILQRKSKIRYINN